MTPDTFIQNFDLLAEAPGGVPKLREMILQLAVRGQLVPQEKGGGRRSPWTWQMDRPVYGRASERLSWRAKPVGH